MDHIRNVDYGAIQHMPGFGAHKWPTINIKLENKGGFRIQKVEEDEEDRMLVGN